MAVNVIKSSNYIENEQFIFLMTDRDTDLIAEIKNKTDLPFRIKSDKYSILVPAKDWVGLLPTTEGISLLYAIKRDKYKIEGIDEINKNNDSPNKYEQLFDDLLSLLDFTLIKNDNDYNGQSDSYGIWSLEDDMCCNYGDIEDDRFNSAAEIIDRLEMYLYDCLIADMNDGFDVDTSIYGSWAEMVENRDEFPDGCQWHLNYLDMICNHVDEIDLNKCKFEEKKEIKPSLDARITALINKADKKYYDEPCIHLDEYRI